MFLINFEYKGSETFQKMGTVKLINNSRINQLQTKRMKRILIRLLNHYQAITQILQMFNYYQSYLSITHNSSLKKEDN